MTNIAPEQLKKLAEHVGRNVINIEEGKVYVTATWFYNEVYNPATNGDQAWELVEKFRNISVNGNTAILRKFENEHGFYGKSPQEAVTLAAIAYVEGL